MRKKVFSCTLEDGKENILRKGYSNETDVHDLRLFMGRPDHDSASKRRLSGAFARGVRPRKREDLIIEDDLPAPHRAAAAPRTALSELQDTERRDLS